MSNIMAFKSKTDDKKAKNKPRHFSIHQVRHMRESISLVLIRKLHLFLSTNDAIFLGEASKPNSFSLIRLN